MKLSGRDFPKLLLALLVSLALVVLAGLLAWATRLEAAKAELERNTAAAAKTQIEQRLRQVRTEEQDIRERTELFRQLQSAGITGEERRLDWMEMLRDIQDELRIPSMNYEFGAQTSVDNAPGAGYAWFSSPMRLQLRLLHEEDLVNFLTRVEKRAKSLVIVRACKLSPVQRTTEARDTMAQLAAECEMQWLTVRRTPEKKTP